EAAIVASFPQATAGLGALATTPVVAAANLVDDTATAIACAKGNQNACAYIIPAIANPIPGMSLASQYADDLTALAKPITNFFDDLAWLRNLPNADNPAGWTLETYGGQTLLLTMSEEQYLMLSARTTGYPITVFKGIQNFNPTQGIVPGAFAGTTNTVRTTYPLGSGMGETSVEQALAHALTGNTAESGFSAWTPRLTTAQLYAGEQGTIVSTTVSLSDPAIIDLVPILNGPGYIPQNPIIRNAWNVVFENEISAGVRQGLTLSEARAQAWQVMYRNAERIVRTTNEILIPGIIENFEIFSP
ncbi:hypothetical protein KKE75_04145, partial [Patescibacteria group bacterium]|nr:hypothetical protein [Patescibacteria group bacterium]